MEIARNAMVRLFHIVLFVPTIFWCTNVYIVWFQKKKHEERTNIIPSPSSQSTSRSYIKKKATLENGEEIIAF